MFGRMVKVELRKAFAGKWFMIAFLIGCALAIASTIASLQMHLLSQPFMDIEFLSKKFTPPSSISVIAYWMVDEAFDPSANLFFLLLPLLAVIPYSWSLLSERASGYAAQIIARSGRVKYFISKSLATFLAGGSVVTLPIMFNLIACMCFAPFYTPDVVGVSIFGVYEKSLWSWFFYNNPILFCFLRIFLIFLFSGLWATFVMSLSSLIKKRIPLLILPYLFLILLKFANEQMITPILGIQEDLTPFGYLRTVPPSYFTSEWVIIFEFVILALFASAFCLKNRRVDVL